MVTPRQTCPICRLRSIIPRRSATAISNSPCGEGLSPSIRWPNRIVRTLTISGGAGEIPATNSENRRDPVYIGKATGSGLPNHYVGSLDRLAGCVSGARRSGFRGDGNAATMVPHSDGDLVVRSDWLRPTGGSIQSRPRSTSERDPPAINSQVLLTLPSR